MALLFIPRLKNFEHGSCRGPNDEDGMSRAACTDYLHKECKKRMCYLAVLFLDSSDARKALKDYSASKNYESIENYSMDACFGPRQCYSQGSVRSRS